MCEKVWNFWLYKEQIRNSATVRSVQRFTESLSLFPLHPAELAPYRKKPIVDYIVKDEQAELYWEEQIENASDHFIWYLCKIFWKTNISYPLIVCGSGDKKC